jgi:hypothetical protein
MAGLAKVADNNFLSNLSDEIIARKEAQMQALWPGRGRSLKSPRRFGTGELANQVCELLSGRYQGKKTQLACDLGIDPKTLNKILADEPVRGSTEDEVKKAIRRLLDDTK